VLGDLDDCDGLVRPRTRQIAGSRQNIHAPVRRRFENFIEDQAVLFIETAEAPCVQPECQQVRLAWFEKALEEVWSPPWIPKTLKSSVWLVLEALQSWAEPQTPLPYQPT
jgi:hypothetical protein